jgi:hypothetical protein
MTRDDIIRLAREASSEHDYDFPNIFALERFADLVAAAEREACALVAESYEPTCESCPSGVANAIRGRKAS